jgi:integration host factor subunit beta
MAQPKKPTYTRKDIVKRLSAMTGGTRQECSAWVERVFTVLRETMMSADPELRIEIRDFGVFEVKLTKSKPKARNPRSGEIIFVPSRRKTHFKPSKLLKGFLTRPIPPGQGAGR